MRVCCVMLQLASAGQLDELAGTLTSVVEAQAPLLKDSDTDSPCCSRQPTGAGVFDLDPSCLSVAPTATMAAGSSADTGNISITAQAAAMAAETAAPSPSTTAGSSCGHAATDCSSACASACSSAWSGGRAVAALDQDVPQGQAILSSSAGSTGTSAMSPPEPISHHHQHNQLQHSRSFRPATIPIELPPHRLSLPPNLGGHEPASPEPASSTGAGHGHPQALPCGSSLSADTTPVQPALAPRSSTPPPNPTAQLPRPLRFLSIRSGVKPSAIGEIGGMEPATLSPTPKATSGPHVTFPDDAADVNATTGRMDTQPLQLRGTSRLKPCPSGSHMEQAAPLLNPPDIFDAHQLSWAASAHGAEAVAHVLGASAVLSRGKALAEHRSLFRTVSDMTHAAPSLQQTYAAQVRPRSLR